VMIGVALNISAAAAADDGRILPAAGEAATLTTTLESGRRKDMARLRVDGPFTKSTMRVGNGNRQEE